uniref:Protein kinase domain-containing protein n=1 Tax=Trypanosoma congolense (strain IL3000) TaxID=1068625 RepID=G0UJK3_TRYCI|nr:putative protein kinase [Trypanosoma congolense IL3000]
MERYDLRHYPFARTVCSAVYLCVDKLTGKQLAAKVLSGRSPNDRRVRRLLHGLQMVSRAGPHPNLISVHGVYNVDEKIYIFMDYARGGNLLGYIKQRGPIPERIVVCLTRQLLDGLTHLHSRGIMHRDIKAENILILEPAEKGKPPTRVCICDYGFTTSSNPTNDCVGSPEYCAPEIALIGVTQDVAGDEGDHWYGEKCDIWSLGVTVYAMLSGMLPFTGDTPTHVFKSILQGRVPFSAPSWRAVSEEGKQFVLYLMTFDASSRPSAREALAHPWLVAQEKA